MKWLTNKSLQLILTVLVIFSASQISFAGPPLICHPYEIGNAKSLPWAGKEWRDVDKSYDLKNIVPDTLALLQPQTSLLVRMETMRRFSIYALWGNYDHKVGLKPADTKSAIELMNHLVQRAKEAEARGLKTTADQLALFDAGYLIETYKNSQPASPNSVGAQYNGLAWVEKANAAMKNSAETEFALAMILKSYNTKAELEQHLKKAALGAAEGSLLAQNLIRQFSEHGASLSQLRASVR